MKFSLIDTFTDVPFRGNPAAVCLWEGNPRDAWMPALARELRLPATAFLTRRAPGVFGIRWFTAAGELELCGHGTFASAHFLREEDCVAPEESIRFESRSGPLVARGPAGAIELDFASETASPCGAPEGLLDALGASARWVGRNRLDYLVEVDDASRVRSLEPDFRRLAAACSPKRGVIVTAASDDERFDFVSRFFAPSVGIDEDPATGSAHCCLGPFWSERLGKADLRAYQASERGGVISVRTGGNGRVYLGGNAVTVLRGAVEMPE